MIGGLSRPVNRASEIDVRQQVVHFNSVSMERMRPCDVTFQFVDAVGQLPGANVAVTRAIQVNGRRCES